MSEKKQDISGSWKLWSSPKPTKVLVKRTLQPIYSTLKKAFRCIRRRSWRSNNTLCSGHNIAGSLFDFGSAFLPLFGDRGENLDQPQTPLFCMGRKVGSQKEWVSFRSADRGKGPASATSHCLAGINIEHVDIGSFFAINFNWDKSFVEEVRHFFVFK